MTTKIQKFSFEIGLPTEGGLVELENNDGFIELEDGTGSVAEEVEYQSSIYKKIEATLLWRFNKAEVLTSIITQKARWYQNNYDKFWADWYTNVFNLATANSFGLAVWAIILNLPIELDIDPDPPDKLVFGFGPDVGAWSEGYGLNFFNANFSNGAAPVILSLSQRRFLLQLRYFQLQSRGSTAEINAFLPTIVGGINNGAGTIYCIDNLDMTITYVFTFTPDPELIPALYQYDVLPRPEGVDVSIIVS